MQRVELTPHHIPQRINHVIVPAFLVRLALLSPALQLQTLNQPRTTLSDAEPYLALAVFQQTLNSTNPITNGRI